MNIKFELYRNTRNDTELLVDNENGHSIYNKIRVYYDGKHMYDESIHVDGEGNYYYEIRNPYCENGSFANRPKDAIRAIKEGYGDIFVKNECFGTGMTFESVYRYIDRDYGNTVKEQTLSVFNEAKFEYAVRFGIKGSKEGIRYVNKNHHLVSANSEEAVSFAEESIATQYKNNAIKVVTTEFENLKKSLNSSMDVGGIVKWINNSDFTKDGKYPPNHIVYALFFALLQEWQENKSDTYVLEVVQTIKV